MVSCRCTLHKNNDGLIRWRVHSTRLRMPLVVTANADSAAGRSEKLREYAKPTMMLMTMTFNEHTQDEQPNKLINGHAWRKLNPRKIS